MVRNYTVALVCTAAVLVCGCQKEEQSPVTAGHTVTLRANAPGNESTKNNFDKDGNIYWLPNDAIGVTTEGAQTLSKLTLSGSGYSQGGNFTGEVTGTVGTWAVYPYNANHQISGTTLTYNLPATYKYSSVDQNYYTAETTSYNNSANIPGYGKIIKNDDGTFSTDFKHLCGVLCIKIKDLPSGTGYIKLTANQKITGDFTVDLSQDTPELASTTASGSENTITINFSAAVQNASGVFFFPMPVGTYNVTVEVGYSDPNRGQMARITTSRTTSIDRKQIRKISMSYDTMATGSYYIVSGHKFVDLGLKSGLLWADRNVGAENYYNYGDRWVWADLSKAVAQWNSYNGYLRVPTANEAKELLTYDYCTLTDTYRSNVHGMLVTGKNGNTNSIFFPYTGGYSNGKQISTPESEGCYWTSTPTYEKESSYAWEYLCGDYNNVFSAEVKDTGGQEKSFSVRLVVSKDNA
jgi:hypothetical protein